LYGSRHLASKWSKSILSQIAAFVLLDLIGTKNPKIKKMFKPTSVKVIFFWHFIKIIFIIFVLAALLEI
jgi:hypothetical protein